WAETAAVDTGRRRQLKQVVQEVVHDQNYVLDFSEELYRGRPEPVLLLKPLTVRDLKPWMWNSKVRKIVLLSATLSQWELYELGLDRRRVAYVEIESAIPPANRPVVLNPVADMSWESRAEAMPAIAAHLAATVSNRRGKGVIHATYDVAARLRGLLSHERLI